MSRHYFPIIPFLTITVICSSGVLADEPKTPDAGPAQRREVRRLMNNFKNAPQPEVANKAREKLFHLGFSRKQIREVSKWDDMLLETKPSFRLKASQQLAKSKSLLRVAAIGNLQRLIATETDPELLWQHAVTLSNIDPESGSALEIIQQTPFDPIMRTTLGLRDFTKEERRLAQKDQGEEFPKRGGTVQGQFVFGDDLQQPFEEEHRIPWERHRRYPPPPPPKIPAPPLIAEQRFDEILALMDQGSDEAWELFRLYGESFPQTRTAKYCIARAFDSDWRGRERALLAMWHAGQDAENAAALSYAIVHDLCLTHQVEMIDRVQQPGAYMRETLKRIRHHENPRMRTAILKAMIRAQDMDPLFFEALKESLHSDNAELKLSAVQSTARLEGHQTPAHAWIKEDFLKAEDPELLSAIASALKDGPLSAEFQQDIIERMDKENSAEINLIFTRCLLDHADPGSDVAKRLETLHKSLVNLRFIQINRALKRELKVIIQQAKETRKQTQVEAIEQLDDLIKVLD